MLSLGAPDLRDGEVIRFQRGARNVEVNLESGRPAFPQPTFEWTKDDQNISNSSGGVFGYPTLTIYTVDMSDSGLYTLAARNNFLEEPFDEIGNDTGSFTLDVVCKCSDVSYNMAYILECS